MAGVASSRVHGGGKRRFEPPDVALLDFHLRGGERSDGLAGSRAATSTRLSPLFCFLRVLSNFPDRHRWLERRSSRSRSAKRSFSLTWVRLSLAVGNGASARREVLISVGDSSP